MITAILTVDPRQPEPARILQAATCLRAGEVVAFPTETVYGLGAIATDAGAVAKIFAAKGRPATDPLIVHIAGFDQISLVTGLAWESMPEAAQRLGAVFWPGPLTMILPRGPLIPDSVTAGRATVGVRMPDHAVALALIQCASAPLAAPSANRFGHTSPTTARHVLDDLAGTLPFILDGGPCTIGIESTILDLTGDEPTILRPGGLAIDAIEMVLGQPVRARPRQSIAKDQAAAAPGMLLTHYAPQARLIVYEGADQALVWRAAMQAVQTFAEHGERVGALLPSELIHQAKTLGATAIADLGNTDDLRGNAANLFAGLRALDDAGVDVIVTGSFVDVGLGIALRDRLWRAAGGRVITVPDR